MRQFNGDSGQPLLLSEGSWDDPAAKRERLEAALWLLAERVWVGEVHALFGLAEVAGPGQGLAPGEVARRIAMPTLPATLLSEAWGKRGPYDAKEEHQPQTPNRIL